MVERERENKGRHRDWLVSVEWERLPSRDIFLSGNVSFTLDKWRWSLVPIAFLFPAPDFPFLPPFSPSRILSSFSGIHKRYFQVHHISYAGLWRRRKRKVKVKGGFYPVSWVNKMFLSRQVNVGNTRTPTDDGHRDERDPFSSFLPSFFSLSFFFLPPLTRKQTKKYPCLPLLSTLPTLWLYEIQPLAVCIQ